MKQVEIIVVFLILRESKMFLPFAAVLSQSFPRAVFPVATDRLGRPDHPHVSADRHGGAAPLQSSEKLPAAGAVAATVAFAVAAFAPAPEVKSSGAGWRLDEQPGKDVHGGQLYRSVKSKNI